MEGQITSANTIEHRSFTLAYWKMVFSSAIFPPVGCRSRTVLILNPIQSKGLYSDKINKSPRRMIIFFYAILGI